MLPLNLYHLKMWAGFFFLTQLFEMPIYIWALHRRFSPYWRVFVLAFGASALTHPIVWFAIPWYSGINYYLLYVLAETFAVVVEATYLCILGIRPWKALGWSLAANGTSVAMSEFLRRVLHWI